MALSDRAGRAAGTSPMSMSRIATAATIGTMIEWYDFFLYGTAAALVFNKLFFPKADPIIGTLLSFAAYGTGFLARPLGGIISGHFGDRVGRKALLVVTLTTMGLATFCIGLLPTYAAVGAAAPILLVLLRIIQGIAVGGEWGGAALLTVENSPRSRAGFWGSFLTIGILLGLVLASLALNAFAQLPPDAFLAWGWRAPFLLSIILVGVGLYIRLRIVETPEFAQVKATHSEARRPVVDALRTRPGSVFTIIGIRIAENGTFYIYAIFSLAYMTKSLGLPPTLALNAVLIASVIECIAAVMFGALSDRIGYRPTLFAGVIFQVLYAFPFFWLLQTKSPALVVLALTLGFALGNGPLTAVQPGFFARFFDTHVRYSGVSLGRELATALAGGLSPLVATALFAWAHSAWPIATMMVLLSLIGVVAVGYSGRSVIEAAAPIPAIAEQQPRGAAPAR